MQMLLLGRNLTELFDKNAVSPIGLTAGATADLLASRMLHKVHLNLVAAQKNHQKLLLPNI